MSSAVRKTFYGIVIFLEPPYTIWNILYEAGYSYQRSRTWCPTGSALRKRKAGVATVTDPDAQPKKS